MKPLGGGWARWVSSDKGQWKAELGQTPNTKAWTLWHALWRCHRSLIGDGLPVRGIRTEDIMRPTCRQAHTLTPFAKMRGTTITDPAETSGSAAKKHPPITRDKGQLK